MKKAILGAIVLLVILSTFSMYIAQMTSGLVLTRQELLIDDPSNEGEPAIFQDSADRIWLFFVSDRTGHNQIHYTTSLDRGLTWSAIELFPPSFDPVKHIFNPVVFQDSTGRIWVAWRNHTAEHNADQVWFTTSDDGENWTTAKQLCDGHNDMGAFVESQGKVWFFFSPLSNYWRVSYKTTDNGGESWSSLVPITTSGGMRTPHATVLANGTIFVVYRVGAYHYEANVGYSASSDGGLPWRSGIVDDPTYPEWDGCPKVIEYNENIYVFFERVYEQGPPYTQHILFRVWNKTKWENPQPLAIDEYTHVGSWPSIISNQLWVLWTSDRSGNWDIWLARFEPPVLTSLIDIDPDTLNLKSNGEWITCYIELSAGFDVGDIDASTILLNGTFGVDLEAPTQVGDYDCDDVADLMVKFDRAAVIAWLGTVDYSEDTRKSIEVTFMIAGKVAGTPFEGIDTVRVLSKG